MDTIRNTEFNSHLVLCIEEPDIVNNTIDNRIFITYDHSSGTYIVIGKRQPLKDLNPAPYRFLFERNSDVFMFLKFIIDSRVSVVMYNFDNLSDDYYECTYDLLESMIDENYEIVAHDNAKITKKDTKDWLDILRNAFNLDNEMVVF